MKETHIQTTKMYENTNKNKEIFNILTYKERKYKRKHKQTNKKVLKGKRFSS